MQIRSIYNELAKITLLVLFISVSFENRTIGQQAANKYSNLVTQADSIYRKGEYLSAARIYNQAFRNLNGYSISYHRLSSARAWNNAGYIDSALSQLYYLVFTMRFDDTSELRKSFLNTSLISTEGFKTIYKKAVCQNLLQTLKYDSSLAKLMELVYESDQLTRSLASSNSGKNDKIYFTQFENEIIVDSIYNKYGWLSPSQIGFKGSQAMFLVVQHGNLKLQLKWQNRIKQGVSECYLIPECYALLTDRILISQSKKQIYGTQLKWNVASKKYEPFPILDTSKVDYLRNKLGMVDLKMYLFIQNNDLKGNP